MAAEAQINAQILPDPALEKKIQDELAQLDHLMQQYKSSGNARLPALFAGLVALILLVLWAATTIHIIRVVLGAVNIAPQDINSGLLLVNTTIGGLISALIVAVLASSEPGGNPMDRMPGFADQTARKRQIALEILVRHERVAAMLEDFADENKDPDYTRLDELSRYMAMDMNINELFERHEFSDEMLTIMRVVRRGGRGSGYDDRGRDFISGVREFFKKDHTWQGLYTLLITIYISVWIAVGCSALWIGVIQDSESSETLQAIGTNWLGIAVAASYAYFGIRPPEQQPEKTA